MLIYTSRKEKAMINPLTLVAYIVLSIYVLVSDGAVQKAPEISFFAEHIYKFDYHSRTEIATGINLTFCSQVDIRVVEESDQAQKLLFTISNVEYSLDDEHGRSGHGQSPYQDLHEGWFAVSRDSYGRISSVYYDLDRSTHNSLNVKKIIASMISMYVLAHESHYDHKETDASGSYVAHYTRSNNGSSLIYRAEGTVIDQHLVKHLQKVIEFGQDGNLKSVRMVEDVVGNSDTEEGSGFFALNTVHSETLLKYLSKHPSNGVPTAPQHIRNDTLDVVQAVVHTQLTQNVREEIENTILSCVEVSDGKCIEELKVLFQHTSGSDLKQFIEDYISTNTDSSKRLAVLLQALCSSQRKDIGIVVADDILLKLPTDAIHHLLSCVSASQPTSGVVDMLHSLAFGRNDRSTADVDLTNRAVLLLGATAKKLGAMDLSSSNDIVEKLHLELHKHTNTKRREISDSTGHQFRHAVLIDSIGNAASDHSLDTIISHINAPHPLTVQHSALRALRHYKNEKSATVLLDMALDGNMHHSLRHAAAQGYHQHPLRERDLTDVIEETSHHLSRHTRTVAATTGLTENVYNVSAPGVGWSRRFGGSNISTELNNRQINDYIISTDPFSTTYEFSLHSATWVDTFLELSDSPEQYELISTSLCFEGRVTYDVNMLQNYQQNLSQQRYDLFSPLSTDLANGIQNSANALINSEANYDGIFDSLHTALASLPAKLSDIRSLLMDYRTIISNVPAGNSFRQSADELYDVINGIYTDANSQASAAMEPISTAINAALPDGPARVTTAAREVQSAALSFSPRETLNEIYSAHTRIVAAVSLLRQRVNDLRAMVDPLSVDDVWVNPPPALDRASNNIDRLVNEIDDLIQYEVMADVTEYRNVRRALLNQLQPAVTSLEELADELLAAVNALYTAFQQTDQHFDSLTTNYEHAWFEVDSIFGQRFGPTFPDTLRLCDISCECGNYPTTTGGLYPEGTDLVTTNGQQIFAPFAGMVRLINSSNPLEADMHEADKTIVLVLTDFNYQDLTMVITNVDPASFVGADGVQVYTGQLIGVTSSDILCDNTPFIHVEIYKELNGISYAIDPAQFLPVQVQPDISLELQCNDVTVMESGMVIRKQPIAGQDPVLQLIEPPIVDVARNEFPQLRDYILSDDYSYTSAGETELFRDSTFLLVGPFPVEFVFTATGRYDIKVSIDAEFLSKSLKSSVVQSSSASIQGHMRVGNSLYAEVAVGGKLLESSVQGFMEQQWEDWPLSAKSSMNLKLSPSLLNLTAALIRQTGAGAFADLEVLDSQVLWQYSVPPVQQEEYMYNGLTQDETAPSFTKLSYDSSDVTPSCFVRQLPNRAYSQPAFEIEIDLEDCEDYLNIAFRVGTYLDGDDVFQVHIFNGQRIVVPDGLETGRRLFVTVEATNSMGLQSIARCQLFTYDTSPPMARINPRSLFSSHPFQLESLLVLFDEYGLVDTYEVSIATSPGDYNNIMQWKEFNTSLINTLPFEPSSNLSLFSAPRTGQLTENIIQVMHNINNGEECAVACLDDSLCKSFDYSADDATCVLQSDIEGPASDSMASYPNNFATPSLRVSSSFYHYEKLGIGNSTNHVFTNLSLESGWNYYINVRLQNRLGYDDIVSSRAIVVDFTPPEPGVIANAVSDTIIADGCSASIVQQCIGPITDQPNHRVIVDGSGSATVFNGPTPLLDALYTGASHFIAVNWYGFRDDESGIHGFTWCVGNLTGSCNVLDYQAAPPLLHPSQAWTNIGLFDTGSWILPDGPYYLSVQAINSVEYGGSLVTTVHHTTPYIVDTSMPLLQIIAVDPYDTVTNTLTVHYMASDDGSGINDVSIALGYTQHDVSLSQWISVSTSGMAVLDIYLPNRINAYIKVRATNNVGLSTVVTWPSDIIVDREPPAVGVVWDGDQVAVDTDYQSDLTQLCITFGGFHGAISYSWAIRTSPGGSNFRNRDLTASESGSKMACMDGLSLSDNTVYYSIITAENVVGLTQTASSDGVLVDATPPDAGRVYSGLVTGIDLQYSSNAFSVQANWMNFTDDESGISHYTVTVFYRTMGSEYTLAYTEQVSNQTQEITLDRFTFDTGYQVLVQLEAQNHAGLVTAVNTTEVTIDLSPPVLTRLNDDSVPTPSQGSDENYQNRNDMYNLNWEVSDPDSNIVRIEAAIYEVTEGRRVLVYPNASTGYEVLPDSDLTPMVHLWTVSGLNLTSGRKYVGTLLFTNGAGLQLRAETNGIIVDTNPPELQSVEVLGIISDPIGGTYSVTSTDVIEGRWQAIDRESNLIQYRAGIKRTDNGLYITSNLDRLVDFQYSRGGIFSGLPLMEGIPYQLEVVAIDQSGLESTRMVSRTFIVVAGDTVGNVRDGEDPDVDIDYTDEIMAVTAHFDGFYSQSCGGIVRYEWAVGIDGIGKEDVFSFTVDGIIFAPDGSGKAQRLVPGLEQYGRHILYITVRAITGCGGILESSSDGFIIDSTPPEVAFTAVGVNTIAASEMEGIAQEHQPYQTEQLLSATWTAADPESGIQDKRLVKIGSYPGGSNIIAESSVTDDFVRSLQMSDDAGEPNYITVSVWNRAGVRQDVTAPAVAWDQTPPHQGEITCDTFAPVNWSIPSVVVESSITCSWSGFYDAESGIDFYSIMIGTAPSEGNLHMAFVIPESTSYSSPVLQFELTLEYYVTFRVSNRAGIQANIVQGPIVVATNIPVPTGIIYVVPNYNEYLYTGNSSQQVLQNNAAQCLFTSPILTVIWDPFTDEHSGISKYQISIGYSPGSDEVHSFQDTQPLITDSGTLSHDLFPVYFPAESRAPVYVSVKGFNNAGYHTTISSNEIYIISDDNTYTSWINDGGDSQTDIEYQTPTGRIEATFSTGVNCPLASIHWAVEATDGMRVLNFTTASVSDSTFNGSYYLSSRDLSLYNGETYRVIVSAVDQTGRAYLLKSDGVTVTTKPLFPGFVQDGPLFTHDLNYQESLTTLSGHWSNFGDGTPEQEIAYYEVALGSDREYSNTRTNIVPFTNVGISTSYTFTGLDLVPLTQQYFITVRAHAVSGAHADATSNGIIAGLGGTIIPGTIFAAPYQTSTTTIAAYWGKFESDFPIRLYSWAVGSEKYSSQELENFCADRSFNYNQSFDVFGFTDVATDTEATVDNLNLTHGISYYVTIRAIDDAKKCIVHQTSIPTVIDITEPLGGKIYVSPEHSRINISENEPYITYIVKDSDIEVQWSEFVDNESSIDQYEVALIQGSECGNASVVINDSISFINVLTETSYVFEGYKLLTNAFIQVIGYNKAGLYTVVNSQPILTDEYLPEAGVVKDGLDWDNDLTYQSDLTSLSAVFSHSKLRPDQTTDDPCPMALNFSLDSDNVAWTILQPLRLVGLDSSKLDHQSDRVTFSTIPNLPGTIITATGDSQMDHIITGAYQTDSVLLYGGGRVSLDIRAALEVSSVSTELKENIATSVVFIDSSTDQLIVEYDREGFDSGHDIDFKAIGLQIHHSNSSTGADTPAKLVLWSRQSITLASPRYASVDIHIDLSQLHHYEFQFKSEQVDTYTIHTVTLYVDGTKMATLEGIPQLSDNTRMLLHLFNRMSYTPLQVDPSNVPEVEAVYSKVRLPVRSTSICQHGSPFHDWGSPIVEFQVGIGSSVSIVDVQEFQTLSYPCKPCIPGPCVEYACVPSCSNVDPYLVPFTLSNLTLSPGYYTNQSSDFTSDLFNNGYSLSSFFTNHFQPAVYYMTVRAVTASGQEVVGTSNGITIDITPPQLVGSVEHFDVEFSATQPTEYQGNNHTIAAKWQFVDLESGIVNYDWAIGSYPGGDDVQGYMSVGLTTNASNSSLEGYLIHNATYYISVRATNGALLVREVTSAGITYIATELNSSALERIVEVTHVEVFEFPPENISGVAPIVLRTDRTDTAAVSWRNVSADVSQIFWRIGTDSGTEDVFPATEVSFGGAQSARINQRTLYLDNMPFAGLAEVFSLAEGTDEASVNDHMAIEPGRLHYHTIQFCSFAHKCVDVKTEPSVVIRTKDMFRVSGIGEDITLTISQFRTRGNIIAVVDRTYSAVIKTTNGVQLNGTLMAGFLNSTNLRLAYRAAVPYISNPFVTMAQTSVEVARRFTTFGGPSFYVSFMGMQTLYGPLNVNLTFDRTLDWSHSVPELLYWDNGNQLWRAVTSTCGSILRIDWITFTMATEVCSTIVDDDETVGSGSGDGNGRTKRQTSQRGYLERPIQMVVAQIGNSSINTPPSLVIPESPLQVDEENVLVYQLEYIDDENDIVDFYLTSLPQYGHANITSSGVLTYIPCTDCTGIDTIGLYILERPFGINIRMDAIGSIQIQINNINDPPEIFFFDSVDDQSIYDNTTIQTVIDANRTDFVSVAQIGAWDIDGSEDHLSVSIRQPSYGRAQAIVWLDIVTTIESLPVNWSQVPLSSGVQFNGQVAFIGVNITYLPDNPDQADYIDQFVVFVRDARRLASTALTVEVEVLYSLCQNNGVCNGSISDPDCTNGTARRAGFEGYSCTCLNGFTGIYCENQTEVSIPTTPIRSCPAGIPLVQCDGDPCDGASCPSHPMATCTPNYCGSCKPQWSLNGNEVQCHANSSTYCRKPLNNNITIALACAGITCDCPEQQIFCPPDSVLVESRLSDCCVQYECRCPNISCPLLMERGTGVQPVPVFRGNKFPGRCCPLYDYQDIDECGERNGLCGGICVNEDHDHRCTCTAGTTLAQDGFNCGVCHRNGQEYLFDDRVKVGCNWCQCMGDGVSSERWRCTLQSCDPTCQYNGNLYAVNSIINQGPNSCTCAPTDTGATWECSLGVSTD